VCEHGAKNHLGVYCLSHDFLSIWWSVLTGFDDRFGIDSLNLRLRLELLSAFTQKKVVQSPTCNATHSKGWIWLALMGNNKSRDRVSSTQLWRKFFKAVTNGIQMLNHLRPDWNELLLARPNSNKSKTTINYFCPASIQNPIRINPLLYCRDELCFEPLFTNHPDAIEELGYLLKSLVGVTTDNSFEKWCHWNHSKECVKVLTRKFTSISVVKDQAFRPNYCCYYRYANDAFKGQ
jgi:hypothetical protein